MSNIGSATDARVIQAAQAQQLVSRSRDRERAATDSARRFRDEVELRLSGTETADAVHALPGNDSEQEHSERERRRPTQPPQNPDDSGQPPRIDMKA